jgi:AhpD family alkylhydroperoxidase
MSEHGHDRLEQFRRERERLNEKLLGSGHKGIQRFFALDHQAYQEGGAVPVKVKEMMGLSCSLVLRCDDCITYHVIRCAEEGITREEFMEIFNVALVVGGSIVIPHLRRAADRMDEALAARDA